MDTPDTSKKDWVPFATTDPFNNNFVEGKISHHHGDDYGALSIEKVNGDKMPQLIYCTPKLAYPFDQNGNWHWPKALTIERYDKLDGTNVFAYRYRDAKGQAYLSYKLRIQPFVKNSRFGPFLDMWRELLKAQPVIARLPWLLAMNLSFEIWGARNPHLVKYEVPLAVSLLFARLLGNILPPSQLKHEAVKDLQAPYQGHVDKDYTWWYQQSQQMLGEGLTELEDGFSGTEGEVWYLLDTTGRWIMFKCKPEVIELIHWAAGGIGKNTIRATIENAFENWDEPTVEQVKGLLREEFQDMDIDKVEESIAKHLDLALAQHEFQEKVMKVYSGLGMNILEDKAGVMRAISSQFNRAEMGKVYAIIWAHTAQ